MSPCNPFTGLLGLVPSILSGLLSQMMFDDPLPWFSWHTLGLALDRSIHSCDVTCSHPAEERGMSWKEQAMLGQTWDASEGGAAGCPEAFWDTRLGALIE